MTLKLLPLLLLCQGLCIIYPVFVSLWFPRSVYDLKCSVYSSAIDVVHMFKCQTARTKSELFVVCHEDCHQRQVGKCVNTV